MTSRVFRDFEDEVRRFEIRRPIGPTERGQFRLATWKWDFEAKARMLDRARGIAAVEAYGNAFGWVPLVGHSHRRRFLRESDAVRAARAREDAIADDQSPAREDAERERHQAEILASLHVATFEHYEKRQLSFWSTFAAVTAIAVSLYFGLSGRSSRSPRLLSEDTGPALREQPIIYPDTLEGAQSLSSPALDSIPAVDDTLRGFDGN